MNPPISKLKESSLNLTVVGTEDAIVMVEAGCQRNLGSQMVEALDFAHGIIRKLIELQKELYAADSAGKAGIRQSPSLMPPK